MESHSMDMKFPFGKIKFWTMKISISYIICLVAHRKRKLFNRYLSSPMEWALFTWKWLFCDHLAFTGHTIHCLEASTAPPRPECYLQLIDQTSFLLTTPDHSHQKEDGLLDQNISRAQCQGCLNWRHTGDPSGAARCRTQRETQGRGMLHPRQKNEAPRQEGARVSNPHPRDRGDLLCWRPRGGRETQRRAGKCSRPKADLDFISCNVKKTLCVASHVSLFK